jgi:hypothetical protein
MLFNPLVVSFYGGFRGMKGLGKYLRGRPEER